MKLTFEIALMVIGYSLLVAVDWKIALGIMILNIVRKLQDENA